MKIHDITKQALTDDLNWEPREGFIVVWSMIDHGRGVAWIDQPSYYVWGMGLWQALPQMRMRGGSAPRPSSTASKPAGWSTAKHAIIYSTYAEAAAQSQAIVAASDPACSVDERNIRVVKVRTRPPVEILDDMPVGLLQRLAEI